MAPVTGRDCPLCGKKFILRLNVRDPWQGYWFGYCPMDHWWFGRKTDDLTRIFELRVDLLSSENEEINKIPCRRCGRNLRFLTFQEDRRYRCPNCTWIVPEDLLPLYLQMCPKCGKVADTWRPPPGNIGYVYQCEAGHIFGGTYPTVIPCNCSTEVVSTSETKEDGIRMFRCGKCSRLLEKPDDSSWKNMREVLERDMKSVGHKKVVRKLFSRIWKQ